MLLVISDVLLLSMRNHAWVTSMWFMGAERRVFVLPKRPLINAYFVQSGQSSRDCSKSQLREILFVT